MELEVTDYCLEIWSWKSPAYIADITGISHNLHMTWTLNDVEELSFDLDLVQFEKRCQAMGTTPDQVLKPYVHDIRVRRNGEYILGCQVVETNIQIDNDAPPKIQVRCTGFLNLFKDSYISMPWSGYTYANLARQLVWYAQQPDFIVKNPTIDIDASYWVSVTGAVARVTSGQKTGAGCLQATRSGTGWNTIGTRLFVRSGVQITIDVWVKGQANVPIYFHERELLNKSSGQTDIGSVTPTSNNTWVHFTANTTTAFDKGYLIIEQNRTNASYNMGVDDCWVFYSGDTSALNDMKVTLGTNTTTGQSNRTMNYELQNVKDAIMELTEMQTDNFDFEFTPDRVFNVMDRKGSDKVEIEAVYPGNIHSMTIERSAANMANKIYNLGSGIGDERLEYLGYSTPSRQTYGTREAVLVNSNVDRMDTLIAQAEGEIALRKEPTDLPQVVVRDGSINPSNTQVGDAIIVRVENDDFLGTINGLYRILKYDLTVDDNNVEQVSLTLEASS